MTKQLRAFICVALLCVLGVLPACAQGFSEVNRVVAEIQKIAPAIRAEKDEFQRDKDLRFMSSALARVGNLTAALQTASAVSQDAWQPSARDEVWRVTARLSRC